MSNITFTRVQYDINSLLNVIDSPNPDHTGYNLTPPLSYDRKNCTYDNSIGEFHFQ